MKTTLIILLMFPWLTSMEEKTTVVSTDPVASLEAPGGSDLIGDWINVHLKTIRNSRILSNHIRQSAYTGIALYESIVAGDKNYKSLAGQLNEYEAPKTLPPTKDICWPSSANTAISIMLGYFYPQSPADLARFDSLKTAWEKRLLQTGYSEASIRAGSEYGSNVAQAVIQWSMSDGADKMNGPYTFPKGEGIWQPTPPNFIPAILPYMGKCRTVVKGSIDNTTPPPPPAYSTDNASSFYQMADEVYQISLKKDESFNATGLFWDDFPDGKTVTGGGHWASILKTVMKERKTSLMEGSMLYAAMFITMNDAAIGCFKAKYIYNQLRPVTYIQKVMNHPEWNPLIVTPPHPEYPAAHATISMSAATILTHLLGDNIPFTDDTYAYRGYKAHHFNNFTEAGREAGLSRLYGGIHYRPSIEAGYKQGEQVAENVAKALVFKN